MHLYFRDTTLDDANDNRVKTATASAAAKTIGNAIDDEPLLLFTNRECDELHVVYPDLSGSRPRLQRMVAYRQQRARTTVQQLANLWHDYGELGKTMGESVRNAFSVQPVTDAFFKEYKTAYDSAVELMTGQLSLMDAKQFTQSLFNRLLFTHFVSRKGWLKLHGDTNYLNALWDDYQASRDETNFYHDRLKYLFFAGLNNPRPQNLSTKIQGRIGTVPFLNGGLFEETNIDRYAASAVPDEAIAPLLGYGNKPGLFNNYNFTVMEATPLDTEVAVDPEMLGKLFEETVNERNSNGAFYTPRSVVSFMCREAIKGYLAGQEITSLTDDKITDLVDNATPEAVTVAQAIDIANAVESLKAVDPACGSGAFLLGMMQEILALNGTLFQAGKTPESLYQQKLDIITNNVYGADQDGLAVSTAMLRLWLSLAVDYDGDGPPKPLPNLDLKLVVGDAIAGPNPQQIDITLASVVHSGLRDDIAAYTTAHGQLKETLKANVEATKQQLRDYMKGAAPTGAIEWRIDFAEVILNGGFDVVVANPPYVQLQRNRGELANLYRGTGYDTFVRTGDIYQLFYERGCQLLKPNHGILAYITSNSWMKAEYGKRTRRYLAESHAPFLLLEMGKDVFNEAIVDTSVLLLRQGPHDNHDGLAIPAIDIDHLDGGIFPPRAEQWGITRPNGDRPWSILSRTEQSIMDKMLAIGTPLKDWDNAINYGIKTGFNKAFIIDNQTKNALVAEDPRSAEIIKPVLRGRDIRRYQAKWAKIWLIDTHNGYDDVPAIDIDDYLAIKAHLDGHYEQLEKRYDKGGTPYNLRNCAYHGHFSHPKLFWADMASKGRFAFSDEECYCNNKGYIMTGRSLKYLCAVLNSSLITWWVKNMAATTGMGLTEWTIVTIERLPIPKVSLDRQAPFVRLVDQILSAVDLNEVGAITLDLAIDHLVYELYGLTGERGQGGQESVKGRRLHLGKRSTPARPGPAPGRSGRPRACGSRPRSSFAAWPCAWPVPSGCVARAPADRL